MPIPAKTLLSLLYLATACRSGAEVHVMKGQPAAAVGSSPSEKLAGAFLGRDYFHSLNQIALVIPKQQLDTETEISVFNVTQPSHEIELVHADSNLLDAPRDSAVVASQTEVTLTLEAGKGSYDERLFLGVNIIKFQDSNAVQPTALTATLTLENFAALGPTLTASPTAATGLELQAPQLNGWIDQQYPSVFMAQDSSGVAMSSGMFHELTQ